MMKSPGDIVRSSLQPHVWKKKKEKLNLSTRVMAWMFCAHCPLLDTAAVQSAGVKGRRSLDSRGSAERGEVMCVNSAASCSDRWTNYSVCPPRSADNQVFSLSAAYSHSGGQTHISPLSRLISVSLSVCAFASLHCNTTLSLHTAQRHTHTHVLKSNGNTTLAVYHNGVQGQRIWSISTLCNKKLGFDRRDGGAYLVGRLLWGSKKVRILKII